jgi:Domain of unknown function (DUF4116)
MSAEERLKLEKAEFEAYCKIILRENEKLKYENSSLRSQNDEYKYFVRFMRNEISDIDKKISDVRDDNWDLIEEKVEPILNDLDIRLRVLNDIDLDQKPVKYINHLPLSLGIMLNIYDKFSWYDLKNINDVNILWKKHYVNYFKNSKPSDNYKSDFFTSLYKIMVDFCSFMWCDDIDSIDEYLKMYPWLSYDPKVVGVMVKIHSSCVVYVSDKLKNDRNIVLTSVSNFGLMLNSVNVQFKHDKEIVQAAVKSHGLALEFVLAPDTALRSASYAKELKHDRDTVLLAVSNNGYAVRYMGEEFKLDDEIISAAIRTHGSVLGMVNSKYKADKNMVLLAVKSDGTAIKYASNKLKQDKDIVLAAITQTPYAKEFIPSKLKKDRDIVAALRKWK